ncbi:MAG: alkaline phosphatase family protein [Anaerolineales bacterium]|nr:alkaline phosphatase family protein [Chloroflexota bacterium]MBK6644315.1 alkaline phosphatase family protein [Anaerolineales bacterium]
MCAFALKNFRFPVTTYFGERSLKHLTVLTLAFLLAACAGLPNIWGSSLPPVPTPTGFPTDPPTVTLTPPASSTPTITPTFTATPTPAATLTPSATPLPSKAGIERAIIISFDGLRPDAIELAPMPNLMELMEGAAYAPLTARTIDYPATSPSHASMLTGYCMEDHGVIYNKYFMYMGYAKGTDVFQLAHEAGMRTVMIVSKDKMRQMAEPETTDIFEIAYGEPAIQEAVLPQIEQDFGLMFVHFAGADNRGHKYDWMSGEYMKVLREGDAVLGEMIKTLKASGMFETTFFLITADHGGHDSNHIGLIIEDYRIPWVAYGPGVIPQTLDLTIYTFDTAATVAYALGLPIQPDWDGIPIYKIFGEEQLQIHEKYPCKN